jgi:hypothetical protein
VSSLQAVQKATMAIVNTVLKIFPENSCQLIELIIDILLMW